jgi:divalent metal cation (Fe/Co/Zn/Cd) transporter
MSTIPHAVPTEQFVERFEMHLIQQERRRKLRQGIWIGLLTLILWLGATAGVLSVGTYLFVNQSALLADFVKSVIYFWAALASWMDSLATAFNTFATTPQAIGLGFGYMLLTMGLLAGWFNYLRRSTQLVEVSVENASPFSTA